MGMNNAKSKELKSMIFYLIYIIYTHLSQQFTFISNCRIIIQQLEKTIFQQIKV